MSRDAPSSNASATATAATPSVSARPPDSGPPRGAVSGRSLRGLAGLVALISLLVLSAPASAQSPAVDQYRESVPTAKGNRPTGSGGGGAKLPREVRDQLEQEGGADADDLDAIATSPELGAPQRRGGDDDDDGQGGAGASRGSRPRAVPAPQERSAIAAAADATTDGGGVALLLAGGAATLLVSLGLVVLRRRSTSD